MTFDPARAASRFAALRDTMTTRAPSSANAIAHARPIPLLAPVTTTILSVRARSMGE